MQVNYSNTHTHLEKYRNAFVYQEVKEQQIRNLKLISSSFHPPFLLPFLAFMFTVLSTSAPPPPFPRMSAGLLNKAAINHSIRSFNLIQQSTWISFTHTQK